MNPEEIPSWRPFLKRIPLFRDISSEDLDKIAALLKPLSLPRGATLFRQGEAGDSFYIITSGQVQLVSEREGKRSVVAFLSRGEALGEGSLLTGEARSLTAILDTTSEFLVLSKKDFVDIVRENPTILMQVTRTISTRLFRETLPRERSKVFQPQILGLLSALPGPDRALMELALAHALVEQTRRRVLLVDAHADHGTLAKALGLKPAPVDEEALRRHDLRDPELLNELVQVHASGLRTLAIPPETLGGKLYRSIFLLMNLFRGHNDFVILCVDTELNDVQKAMLAETDQWMLAGSSALEPLFKRIEAELSGFVPEPKKLIQVWLGDGFPSELLLLPGKEWFRIPWPSELGDQFKAGISPFQTMNRFPKSRSAVERLARRIGRMRLGVSMGTGAALGYSLIGILKTFKRENIPVDLVAGTSIGSVIGGLYTLGLEPEEIERIAIGVDKAWVWENLFWDLTVPRSGFFAGTTLLRFLRSYFGEKEFHDLEIPFTCVATDIETGEEIVFKEGRVAEAIRASCGIPLVFQPFSYQGRFLVDGGLVDPVPIQVLSQMGADILIAVNLTLSAGARKGVSRRNPEAPPAPPEALALSKLKELALPQALKAPNIAQVFFQMIYTMEYEIAQARNPLADVTIHPDLSNFSWTELHRAKELIEAGERIAETALPKIKPLLPFFADYCKVNLGPSWKV